MPVITLPDTQDSFRAWQKMSRIGADVAAVVRQVAHFSSHVRRHPFAVAQVIGSGHGRRDARDIEAAFERYLLYETGSE